MSSAPAVASEIFDVAIVGGGPVGATLGALLAMPAARGLFHKVILQSGTQTRMGTPEEAARGAREVFDRAIKIAKGAAMMTDTTVDVLLESANFHGINIVTYTCDFGNIIIGKTSQRSFRLTNCGKIPISFNFDKKLLNNASIAIEPDKAQKVMPN